MLFDQILFEIVVYYHCCLIRLVSYHCHRDQSRPDRVSPDRKLCTRSPPQRNPSTWTPEMAEETCIEIDLFDVKSLTERV